MDISDALSWMVVARNQISVDREKKEEIHWLLKYQAFSSKLYFIEQLGIRTTYLTYSLSFSLSVFPHLCISLPKK